MPPDPPPILPYADRSIPAGLDDIQIYRVGSDLRRVTVPTGVSFEVTPFAFRLSRSDLFGPDEATWPRSALRAVRVNPFNHRLVLDLAGQDPLEVDVGPTRDRAEAVMYELMASMTVIPIAPLTQQDHASAVDDGLPVASPARTFALRLAAGLALAATAVLFLWPPIACVLYLFAVGAVGIAYGTRRNQWWA